MNSQCSVVAVEEDSNAGRFSAVAARLVEAACLARDGNCEAAKAQIARAMALLRGEPSAIPTNQRNIGQGPPELVRGLAAWQKRRLTTYLDAHLADPIRVSDLAKLLNLSRSHFSRAFRHTFGTSAHNYVTRHRIEASQALMLTTSEALCTIALRCGLSDQSHFTRVFRRIVGETPHVWRRTRAAEIEDRGTEPSRHQASRRRVSTLFSDPASHY